MHLRSAVNFVDFVMLHPHELLLLVSLSSSAARAESDDWTVTAVFFPLFFVSFRHSERWLAMLKSWTCMALNFHHTLGYQPVQQALARFRFRTQNSRYSHSVTSLLQAQFDSDQKMHSWSWTKRFWLSAANMSCHSGLSHLGRKRIYQASLLLRLVKRYYLSHNVAPSKVQSKWPKVMAMLQHLTRNTYHSVQKAKSFNSIAIFCSSWKLSKYQCLKISCHREYFHWTLMGRRHRF